MRLEYNRETGFTECWHGPRIVYVVWGNHYTCKANAISRWLSRLTVHEQDRLLASTTFEPPPDIPDATARSSQ